MGTDILTNQKFLADLFSGPFRGHGVVVAENQFGLMDQQGDPSASDRPLQEWVGPTLKDYENQLAWLEKLGDDRIPVARTHTGTGVFSGAFGCTFHHFEGSAPVTLPLVNNAQEADALDVPDVWKMPATGRLLELAGMLRERLGPDVPISVPDIQSPFDIAALVWEKTDFLMSLHTESESVLRLVNKCEQVLMNFLDSLHEVAGKVNLCHLGMGMPSESGLWLSEDEVGCLSDDMFMNFCMPSLKRLSAKYGGLTIHCCADADRHYPNFAKIPNLQGLNRVFQKSGPQPAIDYFAGKTVLVVLWFEPARLHKMLDLAQPESRFLFQIPWQPEEELMRSYEELRARCKRN